MIYIYPYKQGSRSVRTLRNRLPRSRIIRRRNSRFRPRRGNTVINWGATDIPDYILDRCHVLNFPNRIRRASNKREFFNFIHHETIGNYPAPRFATRIGDIDWNAPTVVRHNVAGHDGQGIEVIENHNNIPNAPLYTQYIKKSEEYRIHVFFGEILLVQQKRRTHRHNNPNWRIRNHDNGFIFAVNNVDGLSEGIQYQCTNLICELGLEFGAIDMIWNDYYQQHYFLEVNTAPGLEGSVLNHYVNAIQAMRES